MWAKKKYLLSLLSGMLLFIGWPPLSLSPLLLVALVPLFIAIKSVVEDNAHKKGKRIFALSFLCFFIFNTLSVYWIYNAISAYNTGTSGIFVSAIISLIPYTLGPLLLSVAVWVTYSVSKNYNNYIKAISFISLFIAAEYLQQSWDLSFPWMTLGNGFAGIHQLVQWYEYTGVYGGTFWILISNIVGFCLYQNLKSGIKTGSLQLTAAFFAVILVPSLYSLFVYVQYEEETNPSNIVIVQPNIDPYNKFGSLTAASQLEVLTTLSDQAAQPNTEFFIWPETAIPNYADEDQIRKNRELLLARDFLTQYPNASLLTGIETIKWYPNAATPSSKFIAERNMYLDNFNSAIQIENSASIQIYHKSKLVPGVEKMPFPTLLAFLKPVFAQLGGSVSGWGWQDQPTVFYSFSGIGTVPVICFESLWGNWIGRSVKNGAQFISIITNDGWWGNTSGKDQHLMYAKLRAIEMRRYVVRSANTGISAIIDQKGDIKAQSKWWTRDALNADIQLNSHITFYAQNGDITAFIAIISGSIFCVIYLANNVRRRFRS